MTTTVTIQTGDHTALVTHAEPGNVRTDKVQPHTTQTVHCWQGKGLTICEETAEKHVIELVPAGAQEGTATTISADAIGKTLEAGDAVAAAGLAPGAQRVSLHQLRDLVEHIEIFRPESVPTMTIAILRLRNGFSLVGKSACIDPKAYNAEKGETFAVDDALRGLWPLEAYRRRIEMAATEKAA
jgi:hypothetical protein